jgi:hypothetical protein
MAATISLPDYFIFTSVDGKPVSNKSQLEVSSDQHLIELQFYEVFSSGADETHFIKSDALYWSVNLTNDEDIQVNTKDILFAANAKSFIKLPLITFDSASIKGETIKLVNHEELMAIIMKQKRKMMQH